jgi:hypothetical protein
MMVNPSPEKTALPQNLWVQKVFEVEGGAAIRTWVFGGMTGQEE